MKKLTNTTAPNGAVVPSSVVSARQRIDYGDAPTAERVRDCLTQWLHSPDYLKACEERGKATPEDLARRLQSALDGIFAFGYPSDLFTIIAAAVAYSEKRRTHDAVPPKRV